MKSLLLLLTLGLITCVASQDRCQSDIDKLKRELKNVKNRMKTMTSTFGDLARQTMTQQFTAEERVRSDGDSGIRLVRGGNRGPQNYYAGSHLSSWAYMSIHDHSNYDRTIGLGEISVVLNGVDFRTRHNDYKLKMPSDSSKDYHATKNVPFPAVPKAVTKLSDIDAQIVEMREWFKAFKNQDHSVRDYRPYFKPVLCYMEGTWTLDKELDEPFESDRHHLDASSWFELMENVRFTAYTGTKNRLENFAFLPTAIMSVNETTGVPNYAQWNYRIMCYPVGEDIPLKYLKQVDDMAFRVPKKRDTDYVFRTRGARFRLWEFDKNKYTKYSLLDRIMAKIPGKDNIPDNLKEDGFGGDEVFKYDEPGVKLNSGYYNRIFKFSKPGAMGLTSVARGFSDENCWVAMNTQKRVAPMRLEVCKKKQCTSLTNRFSYAIPLEIIYLTPLLTWNPWKLKIHDKKGEATKGGKNGNQNKPLNGVDTEHHYITPIQFFKGQTDMSDPADTVKNAVYVLDQNGKKRVTTASGTKIKLQDIEGVGQVRLRYPIAPVYGEGSSMWKELNALRDHVIEQGGNSGGGGGGGGGGDNLPAIIDLQMSPTSTPTDHYHTIAISREDYLDLKAQPTLQIVVQSSESAGHSHELLIHFQATRGFEYIKCGSKTNCWDLHPKPILEVRPARR